MVGIGGFMRKVIFLCLFFMATGAQALCANKVTDLKNIQNLLKKVNLFATWEGNMDGTPLSASLYQNQDGLLQGILNYGQNQYGPTNIKICDDAGAYSFIVYGQELIFEVISKNQIKAYSPFDGTKSVILNKKAKAFWEELIDII